jgi:hypothetical protein
MGAKLRLASGLKGHFHSEGCQSIEPVQHHTPRLHRYILGVEVGNTFGKDTGVYELMYRQRPGQ